MGDEPEKKQKVLHTRIPASLDRQLKKKATRLGMSVSNLVRNVLANTLDLVENVVADSVQVAESAHDLASGELTPLHTADPTMGRSASSPISQVLGWQELILNVNAICATCNAILPKGSRAAIAVVQGNAPRQTLCTGCLPRFEETMATDPPPQ